MAPIPSVTSPFADRVLAAHLWQGKSNNCGPYSAAMVINAFTPTPVDPAYLASEMDRIAWSGGFPVVRRVPNWATLPWGIADILRRNGVSAGWRPAASQTHLVDILASNHIPIVLVGSWRPMWGHVMVLLAHDPVLGWGFADPARPENELHWFEPERFTKIWFTYGNLVVTARVPLGSK
jgi:hypothetical protein